MSLAGKLKKNHFLINPDPEVLLQAAEVAKKQKENDARNNALNYAKNGAENNAKNNKIKSDNRAKVRTAQMELFREKELAAGYKSEAILHGPDADARARLIEQGGGVDLACAHYIGYTAQNNVKDEAFRWLTARGASRPVLTWPDGSIIMATEAREQLEFKIKVVYESTLMGNATTLEAALQRLHHNELKLGHRLWRDVGKGAKHDSKLNGLDHKVFVTYSAKVLRMIEEGTILVKK